MMTISKSFLFVFRKSTLSKIIFVSLFGFLIALILHFSHVIDKTEFALLDYRFSNYSHSERIDTNIVLIEIDQASLDYFEKQKVGWPFPREFYAVVLDYLYKCQAKAVVFDIDFSSSEIDRIDVSSLNSEDKFADAIKRSQNVFLVSLLKSYALSKTNPTFLQNYFPQIDKTKFNNTQNFDGIFPLKSFQEGAKGIGFADVFPDQDGIIRRTPVLVNMNNSLMPSLSFAVYKSLHNLNEQEFVSFSKGIPDGNKNEYLINWYGNKKEASTFKYYSFHRILSSAYQNDQTSNLLTPHNVIKDKIVFIGGTAQGLMDYKPTPTSGSEQMPGMEIHATILSNLLQKDYVTYNSAATTILILLIASLIPSIIFFTVKKVVMAVISILSFGIIYFLFSIGLFYQYGFILSIAAPEAAIFIILVISGVLSYALEGQQKQELKKIFSRYLSPRVIEELIASPDEIEFGGKEIFATVFFSDIKDFTSISEKHSAKELVYHLNKYFGMCTGILLKHEAMLDKYIGDSIMALFGAPISKVGHSLSACYAALEINEVLGEFNRENLQKSLPVFNTRIGINTGKMIVGNIGTETHLDYTAIGDAVNLASRLEGVNKLFGTSIIISESTYQEAKDGIEVRELDFISVKGKETPVNIYELIGRKGNISPLEKRTRDIFSEGIPLYRNKSFPLAEKVFNEVLIVNPSDLAAAHYIDRCKKLQVSPPPDDWDGVYKFLQK